jgi:malonyl CoA-acyl carrier protein transacylase
LRKLAFAALLLAQTAQAQDIAEAIRLGDERGVSAALARPIDRWPMAKRR